MSYEKLNLNDGDILKAEHISHIEDGIVNSSITVDTELSLVSENPVQNRVVTGAIDDVKYIEINAEKSNEYLDLPVTNKAKIAHFQNDASSVFSGYPEYMVFAQDYIKSYLPFNRTSPYEGISYENNNGIVHFTGKTKTSGNYSILYIDEKTGEYYRPIPDEWRGKTITLMAFYSGNYNRYCASRIVFFDANKNLISGANLIVEPTKNITIITKPVPANAVTYWADHCFYSASSEISYDYNVKVCAFIGENYSEISEGDKTLDSTVSNILAVPQSLSGLTYYKTVKDYIDDSSSGIDMSDLHYLTPEMFGAVGDGVIDDTTAISACIDEAIAKEMPVKMLGTYKTSQPIWINTDATDFEINKINYSGTNVALVINGRKNTIRISGIESRGDGIVYLSSRKTNQYNELNINSLYTAKNGIVFISDVNPIYQNIIRFNFISCGGEGYYGITNTYAENVSFITENNFYGGHVANCEYAFCGDGGGSKFYSFEVEGNVGGGFYFPNYDAECLIIGNRHIEGQDGYKPYLKIGKDGSPVRSMIANSGQRLKFISSTPLKVNEIDLSDNATEFVNEYGDTGSQSYQAVGIIDAPIICPGLNTSTSDHRNWDCFSEGAIIWGKNIIFKPDRTRRKVVSVERWDMRANDENLELLPTTFEIAISDCEIFLHASYCFIGYNKFEVIQTETNKAKFYDWRGNLIFDGNEYGAGTFVLEHRQCDEQGYPSIGYPDYKGYATYDGVGTEWHISCLDAGGTQPETVWTSILNETTDGDKTTFTFSIPQSVKKIRLYLVIPPQSAGATNLYLERKRGNYYDAIVNMSSLISTSKQYAYCESEIFVGGIHSFVSKGGDGTTVMQQHVGSLYSGDFTSYGDMQLRVGNEQKPMPSGTIIKVWGTT